MQDPKKDISSLLDKLTPDDLKKVVKGDGIPASVLQETKSVGKKIEDILDEKVNIKVDTDLAVRTVEAVTGNPILNKLVADLTNDPKFLANVDESVKKVLADGKLTPSDVPEIVYLIVNAYNTVGKVRVTNDDLGVFVKLVFEFVVDKYKLLPKDKMVEYESMLFSSVKLLLLTPQVDAAFKNAFKCLPFCAKF
jgi:hypothetical protein